MRKIPLSTKGFIAWVDNDDYDRGMVGPKWYVMKKGSKRSPLFYVARNVIVSGKRKTIQYLHHLILSGRVDHINSNGLDNRKSNLRPATHAQNMRNTRPKPNRTGYRGTHKMYENGFRATISVKGKTTYIGIYPTVKEAAQARDAAALKQYGEFARLNFPI